MGLLLKVNRANASYYHQLPSKEEVEQGQVLQKSFFLGFLHLVSYLSHITSAALSKYAMGCYLVVGWDIQCGNIINLFDLLVNKPLE